MEREAQGARTPLYFILCIVIWLAAIGMVVHESRHIRR